MNFDVCRERHRLRRSGRYVELRPVARTPFPLPRPGQPFSSGLCPGEFCSSLSCRCCCGCWCRSNETGRLLRQVTPVDRTPQEERLCFHSFCCCLLIPNGDGTRRTTERSLTSKPQRWSCLSGLNMYIINMAMGVSSVCCGCSWGKLPSGWLTQRDQLVRAGTRPLNEVIHFV